MRTDTAGRPVSVKRRLLQRMEMQMETYSDVTFQDREVTVDGIKFIRCLFERCKLTYAAAGPVGMEGCGFSECTWNFEGPAADTLAFIRSMGLSLEPSERHKWAAMVLGEAAPPTAG